VSFALIPGLYLGDLICLALTIPVQFGIGKRFYVTSFKSLKHKSIPGKYIGRIMLMRKTGTAKEAAMMKALFHSWIFGGFALIPGLYLGDLICLALTIPVQFGIGKRFYLWSMPQRAMIMVKQL
jgi:hypothetical protein